MTSSPLLVMGGRRKSLRVWMRQLPMGPIDHMPKEVDIMLVVVSYDLSL